MYVAVVTKDVPDYVLVAGVPARVVGEADEKGNGIVTGRPPGGA